ncbi:40S ribosomal protein S3-2-like [Panicum virgatum]|uniref:Uncharacterized protein n=1 Tax=Panicum virgatum TaxID=38727 RepID=A0A8T0UCS8_PANVG|nr:40S ribosomal protein S3-2-like [Panicum virgatum]KAG2620117.1 hypothetical protein PVAP13_3NG147800 [Panicum virgatum]
MPYLLPLSSSFGMRSIQAKEGRGRPDLCRIEPRRVVAHHATASCSRGASELPMATTHAISKKRKFVADGVFFAELNELAEDGYSGVEVRVTPMRTDAGRRPRRRAAASGDARRRRWAMACVEKMEFGIDSIIVALFVFFLFSSMILGLKFWD